MQNDCLPRDANLEFLIREIFSSLSLRVQGKINWEKVVDRRFFISAFFWHNQSV
jgi:hypothetical protein